MSNETKTMIDLNEHSKSVVFEKKEDLESETKIFTLQEQMVNYSNEVLGIKVMSVALPSNYNPKLRSKKQFTSWFKTIKKK